MVVVVGGVLRGKDVDGRSRRGGRLLYYLQLGIKLEGIEKGNRERYQEGTGPF